MSLRINHNIASINGHRNMLKNDMAISKSLEKLSSGLRINRAADDAAGLVISEQMRAQITGLNQAIDNNETAISMVQTAEGALDEVNSLLNKARELVLHAANEGANDINQLEADQAELDNVIQSITRIGDFTQFGTKKLLDGSLDGVGTKAAAFERISVGNLANNTAVANGTFNVNIGATTKSSTTSLTSVAGVGANNVALFGAGSSGLGFSGVAASKTVTSGSIFTLAIAGGPTATINVASGQTVGSLISAANAAFSGAYTVSLVSGKGIKVENSVVSTGAVTFTAGLAKAAVASGLVSAATTGTAGSDAKLTLAMGVASGSALTSQALFDLASFSGVTAATTFKGSGQIAFTFTDADDSVHTATVNYADGATLQSALNAALSGIQANAGSSGLDGATITISGAAAGGFNIVIDTNSESVASMSLSLTIDNQNALNTVNDVEGITIGALTAGQASGLLNVTGANDISGSSVLQEASTFTLTLTDGTAYSVTVNAGQTLTQAAAALEGVMGADFQVVFLGSGADLTGSADLLTSNTGATAAALSGVSTAAAGFWVANTNGVNIGIASLRIDTTAFSGLDYVTSATATGAAGVIADLGLNLKTNSSTYASGTTTVTGAAAVWTAAVASGQLTTATYSGINGDKAIAATLTSSTGLSLTLALNADNSDSTLYTLDLASGNAGFSDIRFEMAKTAIDAAMVSGQSFAFTVDNGAEFQVGANAGQKVGVTIGSIGATELGRNVEGSNGLTSLDDLLSSNDSALTTGKTTEALKVIDAAIDEVTVIRGKLGAFQANTLETNVSSLRVSTENLTAAESTIRDVDFAAESAKFTRNNIMIQASTAMLAQANQLPQNVLQLLG